ncbi:hypothetical protein [Nitrosococcus watsonii]|uniref:Uncharacterized protein n=1 Tax=Nitrosococcus watsoni (strain C-113) TaxID=105559 RepID=D8KCE8_NITWC|nr:hypothetical protein [Nitrosococcus watsonii]ADJ29889.1 hypothetical protein Nwat_3174 [Nitrosococcus watsonii C-113]
MGVSLDKWQDHMERHFSALAERRAVSGLPIFALEHGLSEAEFDKISGQLQSRLNAGLRLAPHWLLWTIYAAERGYTYEGGEYWQSFEEATPGWDSSDRYRVSAWFSKFQKAYNGVIPSGPWAAHFSIIAWPITHAVLPRYLQQQFARTLYDLRYMLARLTSIEPAEIGRLTAANVYYASTRFEQFLQQEELVGRIVLALLHQDPREGEEPLLPATLDRIVADLEKVRYARDWLRETSRVVTDRFKGIGRGSGPRPVASGAESAERRLREARPDIRPDLRLRYAGDGRWTLIIDVPSFKGIAALNPEVRQFLKQTRCTLNGDPGKKPAGWVLSGNRRAVLKEWPNPTKPLVKFEKANGTVDHLLESECRMSDGPIWLFRIGRDGIAREIAGRIVRPGYEYILVSREAFEGVLDGMAPCTIDCKDIQAIRISVPDNVSADYIHWLQHRNLELARTIRVWPAGLPGRHWDGEGRSEWLTTEKPCFRIVPDHPVDSYLIALDGDTATAIQAPASGQPTFVQLPQLAPGKHILTVRARRSAALEDLGAPPAHEGYLELRVREPEPWIPSTTSYTGLVVTSTPHDATLDVFWENELDLTVFGPEGRQITPIVSLENAKGEEVYNAHVCPVMDLPILPSVWRKRFHDFLKREESEWRYLEASSGTLRIEGQELGLYTLRFNHEVLPVRWVLRHNGERVTIRLIDDSGQEGEQPECHFFSMETPTKTEFLKIENALTGFEIKPPGGLYLVRKGKFVNSIIVSDGLSEEGLKGLGVKPTYDQISRNPDSIVHLLKILHSWKMARLAGPLANARRQQVHDGMLVHIYGALAGRDWGFAESKAKVKGNYNLQQVMTRLEALLDRRSGFRVVIQRDVATIQGGRNAIADWYADLASRFGICSNKTLCELAIELASRPHDVPNLYEDRLPRLLNQLIEKPLIVRGARFAALNYTCNDAGSSELLPEWD